jgi:hypothetical protein
MCDSVDYIDRAQDRDHKRIIVNTVLSDLDSQSMIILQGFSVIPLK